MAEQDVTDELRQQSADPIQIRSEAGKITITIDVASVELAELARLLAFAQTEKLVRKADFSENVLNVGDDIKREWWQKNKARYLEQR